MAKAEVSQSTSTMTVRLQVARERDVEITSNPIHDQLFYLDATLRRRLRDEYNVRGWRFIQRLSDNAMGFAPARIFTEWTGANDEEEDGERNADLKDATELRKKFSSLEDGEVRDEDEEDEEDDEDDDVVVDVDRVHLAHD